MIRIAVCDDNQAFLDSVSKFIKMEMSKYFENVTVERFATGKSLLLRHRSDSFDTIFLDIDMPEFTGFDVAGSIRKERNDCYIIFISAHSDLVYDSMDFQPFQFIPKINSKQIKKKLSRVINKLSIHLKQHKKLVLINQEFGRICVRYSDVLYIESDNHHVRYCIWKERDNQKYFIKVRASMGELENSFAEYDFVRVHKKYLVNLSHVFNLNMNNDEVMFKQDFCLLMSRNYKHIVDKKFTDYLRTTV